MSKKIDREQFAYGIVICMMYCELENWRKL